MKGIIMKTLKNDFTTPKQSKRMLELGIPAFTANIMFDKNRRRYELIETEDESWAETQRTLLYNGGAIPHWSVGRLIEIIDICKREDVRITFLMPSETINYIDYLIDILSCKWLNFSKLEE